MLIANEHSLDKSCRGGICDECLIKGQKSVGRRCVRDDSREQQRVVRVFQVVKRSKDSVCRVGEVSGWHPIQREIVGCIADRTYEVNACACVANGARVNQSHFAGRVHIPFQLIKRLAPLREV